MNEETNSVPELPTVDGVYVDNVIETLELIDIEDPDSREYENIETEQDGGM